MLSYVIYTDFFGFRETTCFEGLYPIRVCQKTTYTERSRWKATELRQFLLYTGPVVLKDVLKSQIYENFMLLSVGVYILVSSEYCLRIFLVYNIHGLVHLSQDVKLHGNLDLISGFPYGNFLGQLKKMVMGPYNPDSSDPQVV